MCGIAGIFNFDDRPVADGEVRAMTRAIAHRGPDGEGVYVVGSLGLGHRRLSILDLSDAGCQPMSYADGRYHITYNGEIYNFLELRRELETYGYVFRTASDTEIILAAYDRWKIDCQSKFNGMWAFAIWDEHERTLFLSRDRFGIKPLYYTREPSRFAFASELKAFLSLDGFTPRTNEASMRRVLRDVFSLEGTEECLLEGVKRLMAGHCLTVRGSELKVWRWWNTLDHITAPPATLAEQAEQFRELFFDSCRVRLRSDVPIATCLSGGLDSSSVLCTLAAINSSPNDSGSERRTENWQRAFVATFPGTALDEQRYAEIAIRHAGADPQYRPMSGQAALDELQQVLYDFEDIYLTLPMPAWSIYRELRRDKVVVSLDGHGADEMLGGYLPYTDLALRESGGFLRAPARTLDLVNTLHNLYAPDGLVPQPSRLRLAATREPLVRYSDKMARAVYRRTLKPLRLKYGSSFGERQQMEESWIDASSLTSNEARDRHEEAAINELGAVNANLYRDFHYRLLPTILRNFDRCSMAHGIEVRMPFMDWRLVSFVFSLPEESKIGGGFTKRVLREAMRGVVPEELRTRQNKIGFNSPLPEWFNGSLRDWVWEQVNDQDFLASDIWNGKAVRAFVEQKRRPGAWSWSDCERVWPLLHAHSWQQIFTRKNGHR